MIGSVTLRGCSLAALVLVLMSGCAPQPDPKPAGLVHVTLQANWYAEAEYGGYYEALAKGYYRDAGLDVRIVQGGPGAYPVQKVATGQVQFGLARSDDLILAVQEKLPVVMVSAQLEHDPQVILINEENPVASFAALDGKSIMAEPGSAWISYLERTYKIRINTIPENYEIAQFLSDKGFIQQGFLTSEPFIFRQKHVPVRSLLIADSGYDPYRTLFSSRVYAREHPEVVKAFVAASIRGWNEYLKGDPSLADRLITKDYAPSTPQVLAFARSDIIRAGIASGDPSKGEAAGLITRTRLSAQLAILRDLGLLKADLSVDDIASFDYLPAGLQAQSR